MFPRVIKAYAENGYRVDLGNPSRLYSALLPLDGAQRCDTGGGISISDALLFAALSRAFSPAAIFIIGNAFGLSTFVLAELFPDAAIDVIDAEVEGAHNKRGSELTRAIAAGHFPNVQLTTGFSPQDISRATRSARYQFAFIDGLHTNEQMLADFDGVRPILDEQALVVFHDVALTGMQCAWREAQKRAAADGFKSYELGFTQFGDCAVARGLPAVEEYLQAVASPFGSERYHLGIAPNFASRPRFWTKSAYEVELYFRRKIAALSGKKTS